MTYLIRFIKFIGIVLLFLAGAVLVDINRAAMAFVEGWFPGCGAWACGALAALEALCLFCLWRSVFGRRSHLVLRLDAGEEERRRFREALRRRLAANPHVRKAGIESSDPLFVERALELLDSIAEEEIRAGGSRVFLGTALAQNGRLDALIVFLSLCRTVWRVSSIYNQKPLPAEIWSVYGAVSSATFVAFSIDALDIPQTITDAMSEMIPSVAPAMAASSMPLAGNIAHVFTSAAIHGAANCLLVVRAGVITRRAYRYAASAKGEDDLRSSCVPETAAIVKAISREAVGNIAAALKKQFGLLAREGGRRFVGGIADAAGTAGQKVSDAVTGVAGAAAGTARSAAGLVTDAAHTCAAKAGAAGQMVSDAFGGAAKTASNAVAGAGGRAAGMAHAAMEKAAAAG
ncbi:MAG: hypothetical protein J5838_02150, partial [Desulfovibrio sp.]|nr:hypothetical protein [Desulfovibrio sp.]